MQDTTTIATLVQEKERRQQQNPRYSLRSFARTLGIAPSVLSEIISNKRRLTICIAERIAPKLFPTSPSAAQGFIELAKMERAVRKPTCEKLER